MVWDPGFTKYDFGPHHPMSPVRLDLTARLCESFGLFAHPDIELVNPQIPDDAVLETVHDPVYIAAVKEASTIPELADPRFGLGTDDDPAFLGGGSGPAPAPAHAPIDDELALLEQELANLDSDSDDDGGDGRRR